MITNSFQKHATIAVLILGLSAINAAAATFTVMNANDGGAGSLRDALAQTGANNQPDTITFDPAVFNVQRTITLTSGELVVPPDSATTTGQMVTITGPGANLLTITGNNQRRVFFLARYAQASMSGLTITGGNATGTTNPAFNGSGGGIYVYNGALNLDNVVVSSNRAISGSFGTKGGGGVYYDNAQNSTIANSTFSDNLGQRDNTNGYGGAVYFSRTSGTEIAADYTITNSTFTLNRTGGSGGSTGSTIYVQQGTTASISNSIIENNFSSGIEAYRSLTVENTIVRGNVGTGIYPGPSSNIRNSTINNNGGNGFYVENLGTTNITNSTISNNALLGLFIGSGLVNLDSSTITLNRGGGVPNSDTNFFGGTNLRNTIVAGNTASGSPKDINGTITSQGYNIIGTTSGGTITPTTGDQFNVNPLLAPLASNGGVTQTHALMPGSPAIDAASPANFPAIDQRDHKTAMATARLFPISARLNANPGSRLPCPWPARFPGNCMAARDLLTSTCSRELLQWKAGRAAQTVNTPSSSRF